MNSVELELLAKIALVRDTWAYKALKKSGYSTRVFSEALHEPFDYVEEHWQEYKDLPTRRTLLTKFPVLHDVLPEECRDEPLGVLYEEVVTSRKREALHELLSNVVTSHKDPTVDSDTTITEIQKGVESLYSHFSAVDAESSTLSDLIRNRREELLGTKYIEPGLAAPFLFFQEELGGFAKGEITTVLAKSSVGKTWALLQSAVTASLGNPYHFYNDQTLPADKQFLSEEQCKERAGRVLILSLEMSVMSIAHRLLTLISKVSYSRFKKNDLAPEEMKKLTDLLEQVTVSPDDESVQFLNNIKIIGPSTAHDPDSLNAAAEDFKADLVVVDGFYYMTGEGEKRWEKVESNMQKMRLQTLRTQRHYVLASQMKPGSKTLKSSDMDSAAFSQSIAQDSNNVMILVQEPQMKKERKVVAFLDKARDGVSKIPYVYDWDHHECKYTEIGVQEDDDGMSSEDGII